MARIQNEGTSQKEAQIDQEIHFMEEELKHLRARTMRFTRDIDRENYATAIDSLRNKIKYFEKAYADFKEASRYLWGVKSTYGDLLDEIRKSFTEIKRRYTY